MFLKQSPRKETGRNYLIIAKKVRDPATGKYTDATIESLGYLDEYLDKYPDPIAHFREVARKMTEEEEARRRVTLELDMDETLPEDTDNRKNLGYAAILKIYHQLGLPQFFNNKARHRDFEYSPNAVMTLLVVSRILSPGSKKKAFEEKGRYFERFDFSLVDVYRSLSFFAPLAKEVQRHINEQIVARYGPRDTRTVYYDVTNFYFEIDKEDELRKRGYSKERRRDPIVQMGLAMDADGVPLHYELFPGNVPDKSTFRSVIGEVRRNYDTGRIIVVADMGIITGDNIYYLVGGEKREKALNGYVMSFSIPGATGKFQEYVLDRKDYLGSDGKPAKGGADFIIKSRMDAREINVTMSGGKTKKKTVYEKQVVFWSKKYADQAGVEREKVIQKAMAMIKDPGKYTKATAYGAAKYVMNIDYDDSTGEVITKGNALLLDEEKIREEEKFDGYYAIVTSEINMPDDEIVDTYRGLWEIEESFRITKGDLEARPVHVSRPDRIDAHFLTCFIALVIMRLLQKLTGRRYSCEKIADRLNRVSCSHEDGNIYMLDYRSETSDVIGKALDIDFTKKRLRLNEIKNIIANTKKK